MSVPLILTLDFNPEAFRYFTELRLKHFPPELNYLDAHLTLFHQLPPAGFVVEAIEELCKNQAVFQMQVSKLVLIGNGVAFKVESELLQNIHRTLQQNWQAYLIPQDRQKIWPHITIQNKVSPESAKVLLLELGESFKPFTISAQGLSLWEYLSGLWKFYRGFGFN